MIKIEITGNTAVEIKNELKSLLEIEAIRVTEVDKPTQMTVKTEKEKTVVPKKVVEADLKVPTAKQPAEPEPVTPVIPTVNKTYTVGDLQEMAQQLMSKIGREKTVETLRDILAKYSVAALTKLEGAQLGQVAEELKALGADA